MEPQCIQHTRNWVESIVVGLNFCPFAAKEMRRGGIRYAVVNDGDIRTCLLKVLEECQFLDKNEHIRTTLLIFPQGMEDFEDYLDAVFLAEELLIEQDYEGIYQIASFHPDYQFAGNTPNDPANCTNRAPYPMLHLLREDVMEAALKHFPNPESIPEVNKKRARDLGLAQMMALRNACFTS